MERSNPAIGPVKKPWPATHRLTCAAQGFARTPRRPCSAASTASPSRGVSQPPVSPDHWALRARRPCFRIDGARRLYHRDDACRQTGEPLAWSLTTARRNRRVRRRRQIPVSQGGAVRVVYTDFQDQVKGVREEEVVYMPKMTGVQYEKKAQGLPEEPPRPHRHPPSTNQPAAHHDRFAGIGEDPGGDR